jgi:predicted N-acetyltransferase YhbS
VPAANVRSLRREDDPSSFRSGHKDLDRFLVRHATRNHFDLKLARTYVVAEGARILGYVTLTGGALRGVELPACDGLDFPGYPLPVVVLARLAVAADAQRQGVGEALMRFTFDVAVSQSERIGCIGVAVDSKVDAVPYYERFGFRRFDRSERRTDTTAMFLALRLIQRAIAESGTSEPLP